jgi:hypothetical protein
MFYYFVGIVIFKVRKIINMVSRSSVIKRHVIDKAKALSNVNSDFILDFCVRWNTSYLMLERFYQLKLIVDEITCNPQLILGIKLRSEKKLRSLVITKEDWDTIVLMTNLLKPFYKASVMLQGQKYQTLSMAKVVETILLEYYANIDPSDTKQFHVANRLNEYLKAHLVTKISREQKRTSLVTILKERILKIKLFYFFYFTFKLATYLDPETHSYLDEKKIEDVDKHLRELYPFFRNEPDNVYLETENNTPTVKKSTLLDNFANEMGIL